MFIGRSVAEPDILLIRTGGWMRSIALGLGLVFAGTPASAATVVILTDPMTLDRHAFVVDRKGPDRILMCMAPPSVSGCTQVKLKRAPARR